MLDFYNYIYKYFKLAIFSSLFMLVNIVAYIDGFVVHANNVYISDNYLLEQQMKYTKAIYWLNIENKISNDSLLSINLNNESNKYNSIGYDFSLLIDNLWIMENLFTFPIVFSNEDYEYINSKKIDQNMIDYELLDITNIQKWFIIWAHSSGLWSDKSQLKKVFNSLDELVIWDEIVLKRSDWVNITYLVKEKSIKDLDEKLILSNKLYLYTCYPVGSTEQRLIVELSEKL